ncbi:GNAT family N-acetyltransferase [Burkholderia thailandensis]|uniref:GNAT family N-acetyltransferase n=1 Tax=Burkholderia thailandensis TaxID=57975 RepID=UPI00047429F4|nr:GNAT family N-acetyltransferase [Burkholderia thailandensis]MCS3399215.1 GNAT family N-acetyltransferase [Burkholderia thailandensis]MCS6470543.1 GNAT family N-acetyltransferase [Burkholderia thailandensis]MCS6477643.1 GNAT family N-acetyltransferase [Burkholderia thailandensis]MCS6494087.1 GNAT family N-acetyltransferase [Burkholderia thailandensis]MCS6499824.1 GNAT family N-acetyltransferase [Burkholderia thailandensis]
MTAQDSATRPSPIRIRAARADEAPLMAAVEAAAAHRFDGIGMPHIASSPPTDLADLHERIDDDRALVAVDADGERIVGFAIYRILDASRLYIEEVDVAPGHAGRRIGSALIEAVAARARAAGARQVVLSTFRHVPWNAPYYRRLGFVDLDDGTLDPALAAIRAVHVAHGLDESQRVFMMRGVGE